MFGILESLTKATLGVVLTPVAMVTDVAEALDIIPDSGKSHTGEMLSTVVENL